MSISAEPNSAASTTIVAQMDEDTPVELELRAGNCVRASKRISQALINENAECRRG